MKNCSAFLLCLVAALNSPAAVRYVSANVPRQLDETSYLDTNAVGASPFFYRVGVQP